MPALRPEDFIKRRLELKSYEEKESLLKDAIETENEYRSLFSRHRESWQIPEVEDPFLGLVDVFKNKDVFKCLPKYAEDAAPRCFELAEKRLPEGDLSVVPSLKEFAASWDCFTESQLRFLDWSNVFAAGGSIAGCLQPLPEKVQSSNWAEARKKRRPYFHDEAFPGSDVDLFLYGLDAERAEAKLIDIFEAVQAANPYEVLCFRSAYAVTLVSQYPFRHIQIVLRLYNSPAEVLMGFDVDSCACGFDGKDVYVCQRTALAFAAQANTVDMSRRSPSYEMRLAKYAQRGFEVVVPKLKRERVDPFVYEKRFDQVQGLSRLLLLERLKTPEARFKYRMEQKLKKAARNEQYKIRRELNRVLRDKHELARQENSLASAGAELSNYSTVFLPWGSSWTASKVKRVMAKKDRILNTIEFRPGGRVVKCTRKYKVHVCAAGLMSDVIKDPFPSDPPIPADVPPESLAQCVHGPISWLVDNPGRQQIGSFNPITDGDWAEGAYLSVAMEAIAACCAADDAEGLAVQLAKEGSADHLNSRDFLGRSALHVAALGHSTKACTVLLEHPKAGQELLNARLADGRFALHLASMHGFDDIVSLILEKRKAIFKSGVGDEQNPPPASEEEVLDIDAADWELKLSPLQYAVVFGYEKTVSVLLQGGAAAKKLAVHKDKNMSKSALSLCAQYGGDSRNAAVTERIAQLLFASGALTSQVDTAFQTVYHQLAQHEHHADILEVFLKIDANKSQVLDVVDAQGNSALALAVQSGNKTAVKLLLQHGALVQFTEEDFAARKRRAQPASKQGHQFGFHSNRGGDAMSSCPILFAAGSGTMDILQIFLEHSPDLAKVTLKQQRSPEKSLLDIVRSKLVELEAQDEQKKEGNSDKEEKLAAAKDMLHKHAEGTYGWSLCSTALWRVENESNHQSMFGGGMFSNDDDDDEATREQKLAKKKQCIQDSMELIQKLGGTKVLEEDDNEATGGAARKKAKRKQPELVDPLLDYAEIPAFQPGQRWMRLKRLPKGEQAPAHQLFEAAFKGDASALASHASAVRICTASYTGATPLWLATLRGETSQVRTIFAFAAQQFHPPKRAKADEGDGTVTGQLRHVNNLELAAGGGLPKDGKLSPDEMRQRLEKLEQGVLAGGSAESADANVSTQVPPSTLLATSCATLTSTVNSLDTLLQRIEEARKILGTGDDEEGDASSSKCIKLSPLEVAVIQDDLPMVKTLLALASSDTATADNEGKAADEQANKKGEENDEDEEKEDSNDEASDDECDEDEDVGVVGGKEEKDTHIKDLHLNLLRCKNTSLGNLDVLELAIFLDRPEVFVTLATFAEELSLSLGAVSAWQQDVEEGKSHLQVGFSGEAPTPLQLALSFGSTKILNLLLSGGADDALLGFLYSGTSVKGKAATAAPYLTARKWLQDRVKSMAIPRAELSKRLLGPEAVDRNGRTALFYATAKSLPDFMAQLKNAPNLEHRLPGHAGRLGRRRQLPANDEKEFPGFTALMVAAHSGRTADVLALLKAGCKATALAGKQNWNALHCAVAGIANRSCEDTSKPQSLDVVEALLASPDAPEQLFVPEAEHTPLMVAVQKGAPVELVRLLGQRMVEAGVNGVQALARNDTQLRNAMHLGAALEKPDPEVLKVLLETAKTSGDDKVNARLNAIVENGCGSTPLELIMEKVSQIWEGRNQNNGMMRMRPRRKRGRSTALEDPNSKTKPSSERLAYNVLSESIGKQDRRTSVTFDEVQGAAQQSTKDADQDASNHFGNPMMAGEEQGIAAPPMPLEDQRRMFGMFTHGLFPNIS